MNSIVWFRQDLRLADNPALAHAARKGRVLPLYVLDETPPPAGRPMGGAQRWWLHHSLAALAKDLGGLVLLRGNPAQLIPELAARVGATSICWNRCYEPYAIARDTALQAALTAGGVDVESFNGSLLFEPWAVRTLSGDPFKVYSAFWRACLKLGADSPIPGSRFKLAPTEGLGEHLADWQLLPTRPNWASAFARIWHPGETGAHRCLDRFLAKGLQGYATLRNRPDLPNVSRLSPHLHFGEISPRQILAPLQTARLAGDAANDDVDRFLAELGWREFAYHLLYHFPALPERNWRPAFDEYPWRESAPLLAAWQRGRTGYPLVDAGMRELWATGYMHNRVRMIVASFLVKHLRIHWREGEAWFWDTLLDADLANNAASWQWVAGSGADAAPYFRIFNPIEQGRRFDPDGAYVRRWCPELAKLPAESMHAPFEADPRALAAAGVVIGEQYPKPIVGHAESRKAALAGYEAVKRVARRGQ
jgi:deoxyribodipyrimidine photo-lyase